MASPASSTTSTKAATLFREKRKGRRSSSFPTIAAFKSFRKKPLPQALPPREPFEVAPGILNTDASAKVFGYVDTDDEPAEPRTQSMKPKKRNQDEAEPTPTRTVSVRKGKRGMRMVSSEDRLTERGANPRTGLVSPFVTSDSDQGHSHDYMTAPKPFAKARTRSGKWKQDGLGWSLVERPLLSPIAQSTHAPPTRQVSLKELEDKLLVEMPGVDNPEPENPTDLQVRVYQEQMARICRKEGSDAIVDPDTLPTPRQWTPEGPSSPPSKLHKMVKRKKVGSGMHTLDDSIGTVIVDERKRASSMPTPKHFAREPQRVRIVTPSNTPRELSLETQVEFQDPFLGLQSKPPSDQPQYAIQPRYLQTRLQEAAHRQQATFHTPSPHQFRCPQTGPQEAANRPVQPQRPHPSKEGCLVPPAIPTLSQYLPQIHLQHPSELATLKSPSCRRPNQLLPARLRPLHQQRRLVEDACTNINTSTTTSVRMPKKYQRPKIQRQNGSVVVPRALQLPQENTLSKENRIEVPAELPNQRQPSSTNFMAKSQECTTELPQRQPPLRNMNSRTPEPRTKIPGWSLESAGTVKESPQKSKDSVLSLGAEGAAKAAWSHQPNTMTQDLRAGSANIVREPIQKSQRNGAGITRTYARHGDKPAEFAVRSDGSTWFAGHWADVDKDHVHVDSVIRSRDRPLVRRRSFGMKTADVRLWIDAVESQLRISTKVTCLLQWLYAVVCCIFRALRSFPPALRVLMTSDVEAHDYLIASKDSFLAAFYLLLLTYVLFIACKVVVLAANILYWVWHPVSMVLVMLKWCTG